MGEEISERVLEQGASPKDCIPTIVRFAAQSLLMHYRRFDGSQLDELFMGGGGSSNPNIVNILKENTPDTRNTTVDEIVILERAKEALDLPSRRMKVS